MQLKLSKFQGDNSTAVKAEWGTNLFCAVGGKV